LVQRAVKDHGKIAAARGRFVLSSLFAYAMREGWVGRNPVISVDDPGEGAQPRERVLSDVELGAVWNAASDDSEYGKISRLLILTAQRRQEVVSMSWDELDPQTGTWRIPGERAKNHRSHQLILPKAAWDLIKQVPHRHNIPFLSGDYRGFVSWSRSKDDLDERCKIKPWVVHDLRRTAATRMAELGVAPHVIDAVQNHVSGYKTGVRAVYIKSTYQKETAKALELWAGELRRVVSGKRRILIPA
jgi:integrase